LQTLAVAVLFGALVATCITDWQTRKIPNALVLLVLLLGFAFQAAAPAGSGLFHATDPGSVGLLKSLGGVAVGLLIFFPLFALRAMGAGDAKLFAAIGAWLGVSATAWAALWTFVAGGLLALVAMAAARSGKQVLSNVGGMLFGLLGRMSLRMGATVVAPAQTTGRLPYAFAITAGTAFEVSRPYLIKAWST
jgi:prepilin peptidase CpaA